MTVIIPRNEYSYLEQHSKTRGTLVAFGPRSPIYYRNESKVLVPIDLSVIEEKDTGRGRNPIRTQGRCSIGVRSDANPEKLIGLRPSDDQTIQFELGLKEGGFNGREVTSSLLSPRNEGKVFEFGGMRLDSWKTSSKILFPLHEALSEFDITFRLTTSGLKRDGFKFFDSAGKLRFELSHPILYKPDGFYPEGFPIPPLLLNHELVEIGDGEYEYRKWATPQLLELLSHNTQELLLDATTNYTGHSSDGVLYLYDTTSWASAWASTTCSYVFNTTIGEKVGIDYATGQWEVYRGHYFFDTSGLPDDCTVSATSKFYVYVHSKSAPSFTMACQRGLVSGTPPSLTTSHYNKTYFGTWVSAVGVSTGWLYFPIDSGDTSLTSYTRLSLREWNYDYSNVSPSEDHYAYIYMQESSGYDPYVRIDYTLTAQDIDSDDTSVVTQVVSPALTRVKTVDPGDVASAGTSVDTTILASVLEITLTAIACLSSVGSAEVERLVGITGSDISVLSEVTESELTSPYYLFTDDAYSISTVPEVTTVLTHTIRMPDIRSLTYTIEPIIIWSYSLEPADAYSTGAIGEVTFTGIDRIISPEDCYSLLIAEEIDFSGIHAIIDVDSFYQVTVARLRRTTVHNKTTLDVDNLTALAYTSSMSNLTPHHSLSLDDLVSESATTLTANLVLLFTFIIGLEDIEVASEVEEINVGPLWLLTPEDTYSLVLSPLIQFPSFNEEADTRIRSLTINRSVGKA